MKEYIIKTHNNITIFKLQLTCVQGNKLNYLRD